jgi:hypothetical protein
VRPAHIGEQVFVLLDPDKNNGADHAVAWVTNEFGKPFGHSEGRVRQTVNVRALEDGHGTLWLTSISLFDERPSADTLARLSEFNPKGHRSIAYRREVDF